MEKQNSCGLVSSDIHWILNSPHLATLSVNFAISSFASSSCLFSFITSSHAWLQKKLVLKIHPLPVQVAYSIGHVNLFLWLSNFFLQLLNLILNLFKITDMHVITILCATACRFSACAFTAFRNTTCIASVQCYYNIDVSCP